MISSLRGIISEKFIGGVEVEVGGVGYFVSVTSKLREKLVISEQVKLFTYMAVSENDQALYGFGNREELEMFRMLLTVSGVGPKGAMLIMGAGEVGEIKRAIGDARVDFFEKVKGVGKKTAQRIIVDLKSKVGGVGEIDLSGNEVEMGDEVIMSLKQLGFDRKEIEAVVRKVPGEFESVEDRLSWCLKNLG